MLSRADSGTHNEELPGTDAPDREVGEVPGAAHDQGLVEVRQCRCGQASLPHPEQNLPNRLQFGEPGENQSDRFLNAPVRVLLDPVVRGLQIADCDGEEELPAASLLLQGFERPLAGQRHRPPNTSTRVTSERTIGRSTWS